MRSSDSWVWVARFLIVVAALLLFFTPECHANRLFTSGCETNDNAATEWQFNTTGTFSTTTVKSGTYACRVNTAAALGRFFDDLAAKTSGSLFWRTYFRAASWDTSAGRPVFSVRNAAGTALYSVDSIDVGGQRRWQLENSVAATTVDCAQDLSLDTWYRLEVGVVIAESPSGSVELRAYTGDSTTADCNVSLTAQDTLTTDVTRTVFPNTNTTTQDYFYDDIAINDAVGSAPLNTWPGPGSVALMEPASNDTVTYTRTGANCSGTTNTDCVDDEPGTPDDLSGYNSGGATTDRFNSTTLTGPDSDDDILVVHVYARGGGSSTTGTNTGRLSIWDEGGTETNSTTQAWCDRNGFAAPSLSALDTWSLAFNPVNDVKATVESYDLGYEGVSVAQTCRWTSLWANVEWKAAEAGAAPTCVTLPLLGAGGCKP